MRLNDWLDARRARRSVRTYLLGIRAVSQRAVVLIGPPPRSPRPTGGHARRAGTRPGPPRPPSTRQTVDLAALQRLWDTVATRSHPLLTLVEIALARPRQTSTSVSPEAVDLIGSELRPLRELLPHLEKAMVTGTMTAEDYTRVGGLFDSLAAQWRALPESHPDSPPPSLAPAS